jgi:hypothetical protein
MNIFFSCFSLFRAFFKSFAIQNSPCPLHLVNFPAGVPVPMRIKILSGSELMTQSESLIVSLAPHLLSVLNPQAHAGSPAEAECSAALQHAEVEGAGLSAVTTLPLAEAPASSSAVHDEGD